MARKNRAWHANFMKYMKLIVKHPNYKDMPEPYKKDGSIRWVVSGNSDLGIRRAKWWDNKVRKMQLVNRAEVARAIHPKELNGKKPCQICGKELSIFYVYPNKNTLKRIKNQTGITFKIYELGITQIFDNIHEKFKDKTFDFFRAIFRVPDAIPNTKEDLLRYILDNCKSDLSPGVMSNPPDRFDGFHTYNACCRSREDTGRHGSNLARYSQDRRAYENWAEGDWNLSNRLMGEFKRFSEERVCPNCGKKSRMSADHIGPISLGFTHRPKFNALCNSCNSAKNNRMTLDDIRTLIKDEKKGPQVISWHSKYIWDKTKNAIKDEGQALKLSKAMRLNLHNVLTVLALIKEKGYSDFLRRYLHPEYSFFDYKFEDFDPLNLANLKIIKKKLSSKNKEKNAERYVRISLESLDDYMGKDNRRVKGLENKQVKKLLDELFELLAQKRYEKAQEKLENVIQAVSDEAILAFF